ncbi:MAG: UDP-N-acetylmuramoyl-tripeptide--D-alanyl-D-alanine ligase [Planctomycetaceae bacterium]|nr:UDP-N-acetylmuramoyl-tripeptide--D-alanyl-D-alanine ligase [Planctomycetaceae bacterium]
MFPITLARVIEIVGGRFHSGTDSQSNTDPDSILLSGNASIDSRQIAEGDVFFAFPGSGRHGIEFVDQAMANGAICAIAEHAANSTGVTQSSMVLVPDVQRALWQLAAWNRSEFDGAIICVTGSVGKTTTRQLIHTVLQEEGHYCGIQSDRNFNNHLGVPLTLLRLNRNHQFAVVEIGASSRGEISKLAALAEPEIGVVTRVGPAHLTGFGSVDAIQSSKRELVEAVAESGCVVLNADDALVNSMAIAANCRVIRVSISEVKKLRFNNGVIQFEWDHQPFAIRVTGSHLLMDVLLAIAVGREMGVNIRQMAERLCHFIPNAGRGAMWAGSNLTVVDDSYNASPASVAAAISALGHWQGSRRILVLGDMLELGEQAEHYHTVAGEEIYRGGIDVCLLLGDFGECVRKGCLNVAGCCGTQIACFGSDIRGLCAALESELTRSPYKTVVWVKGSRGLQMERVVEHLREQFGLNPFEPSAQRFEPGI